MPLTRRKYVPTGDLIRALHRCDAKRRWLAVLRLYADSSGKDSDLVRVAACYIAESKKWTEFNREWQRALDQAKVNAFHATDFFNFQREFKGWDEDKAKHERFAKLFTAIAERRTEIGVAHGVAVEPFNRLLAPVLVGIKSAPQQRMTALMLCAGMMLHDVGVRWKRSRGQIAVLFEWEEGIGQITEYFQYLKHRIKAPWTDAFVSAGTAGKEVLPLQAADLLAHESWRRMKEHLRPTGRPVRKTLTRLLRNSHLKIDCADEANIQSWLPSIQAYMDEGRLY